MDAGLIALVGLGVFATSMAFWPAWFKAEVRRKKARDPRYIPPTGLGIFDEVYRPATYAATQELRQERRKSDTAPAPGEPKK
jgi:hypothetical protein